MRRLEALPNAGFVNSDRKKLCPLEGKQALFFGRPREIAQAAIKFAQEGAAIILMHPFAGTDREHRKQRQEAEKIMRVVEQDSWISVIEGNLHLFEGIETLKKALGNWFGERMDILFLDFSSTSNDADEFLADKLRGVLNPDRDKDISITVFSKNLAESF